MIDYRCKTCGWWLFCTDASAGRVTVNCSNRQCQMRQTIVFDGRPVRDETPPLAKRSRVS